MAKPSVCAVMLYADRPHFIRRAMESFRRQTYANKELLCYDNGQEPLSFVGMDNEYAVYDRVKGRSIGMLRNDANAHVPSDIIVHWDVDDYSHPNRIAEQVALLESSGKEVVGYRDMLFWDETPGQFCGAWMYENRNSKFLLGTSLCYWRSVWERKPFPDLPIPGKPQSAGEDTVWLSGLNRLGESSTYGYEEPRMIASIHGGNTTGFWLQHRDKEPMFCRAPEWDEYCRVRMNL